MKNMYIHSYAIAETIQILRDTYTVTRYILGVKNKLYPIIKIERAWSWDKAKEIKLFYSYKDIMSYLNDIGYNQFVAHQIKNDRMIMHNKKQIQKFFNTNKCKYLLKKYDIFLVNLCSSNGRADIIENPNLDEWEFKIKQ